MGGAADLLPARSGVFRRGKVVRISPAVHVHTEFQIHIGEPLDNPVDNGWRGARQLFQQFPLGELNELAHPQDAMVNELAAQDSKILIATK